MDNMEPVGTHNIPTTEEILTNPIHILLDLLSECKHGNMWQTLATSSEHSARGQYLFNEFSHISMKVTMDAVILQFNTIQLLCAAHTHTITIHEILAVCHVDTIHPIKNRFFIK